MEGNWLYALMALLAIGLAFTLGFYAGSSGEQVRTIVADTPGNQLQNSTQQSNIIKPILLEPLQRTSLTLPAVDQERRGASAALEVERRNGTGRAFLNFNENEPVLANETQRSIKNAIKVAKSFNSLTRQRSAVSDLFYSFKTDSNEVGGSSAGAAISVATIALLEGKQLNGSITITGSVGEDGRIGPVGSVVEKARAVQQLGLTTFLVPVGEATRAVNTVNETQNCTRQAIGGGVFTSCRTVQYIATNNVNVSAEVGINVIEVPDVASAYAIMLAK